MIKECEKYYLVEIGGVKTPIRHKYTNLQDEWYLPDGTMMTDDQVNDVLSQISESTRITDTTIYQKEIDIYGNTQSILEGIGDIKAVLDYINGEVV